SPFAAVFQAALKGVGNNGKLPLAGKTQDSSREPASTTGTGNNMFGPLPQGMVAAAFVPIDPGPSLSVVAAPVPIAPIVPNSATTQGAAAVSNPLSLEAMTKLDRNTGQARGTEQGPPASSTPLPSAAMTRLAMTTVQARATPTAQEAPTLPNAPLSQATTGLALNTVHASALPQDLNAATKIAVNDFDPQPVSIFSAGVSHDAAPLQSTAPGTTAVQTNALDSNGSANPTNVFVPVAAEQTIPIGPIADS